MCDHGAEMTGKVTIADLTRYYQSRPSVQFMPNQSIYKPTIPFKPTSFIALPAGAIITLDDLAESLTLQETHSAIVQCCSIISGQCHGC